MYRLVGDIQDETPSAGALDHDALAHSAPARDDRVRHGVHGRVLEEAPDVEDGRAAQAERFGFSLAGSDHPDALYRAAGAPDRARSGLVCPCCKRAARRPIRVRAHERAGWSAVCAICAASLLSMHPGSVVGGFVRPTRRRRRSRRAG